MPVAPLTRLGRSVCPLHRGSQSVGQTPLGGGVVHLAAALQVACGSTCVRLVSEPELPDPVVASWLCLLAHTGVLHTVSKPSTLAAAILRAASPEHPSRTPLLDFIANVFVAPFSQWQVRMGSGFTGFRASGALQYHARCPAYACSHPRERICRFVNDVLLLLLQEVSALATTLSRASPQPSCSSSSAAAAPQTSTVLRAYAQLIGDGACQPPVGASCDAGGLLQELWDTCAPGIERGAPLAQPGSPATSTPCVGAFSAATSASAPKQRAGMPQLADGLSSPQQGPPELVEALAALGSHVPDCTQLHTRPGPRQPLCAGALRSGHTLVQMMADRSNHRELWRGCNAVIAAAEYTPSSLGCSATADGNPGGRARTHICTLVCVGTGAWWMRARTWHLVA